MNTTLYELRHAARQFMKHPGFTLIAVVTLGLGIGANTAIFSVVNAVLLRPLPYEEADRLVIVSESNPIQGRQDMNLSHPTFLDFAERNESFERLAALRTSVVTLAGGDEAARVRIALVTHDLFATLRVAPARGRTFDSEEDRPDGAPVVVVSHGLWQRRFGADPALIGKSITLNGSPYAVIGIMPPGFAFPSETIELWAALGPYTTNTQNRGVHILLVVGRLERNVMLREAQAEVEAIADAIQQEFPDADPGHTAYVTPLQTRLVGDMRFPLLVLFGAVVFVLLIACANVADLVMVRAFARYKEVAVRTALGASRWRLMRQLLMESMLLALAGGALAVAFALWGIDLLVASISGFVPRADLIGVDVQVLVFTLAVSIATGVAFGLLPALRASKSDVAQALKERLPSTGGGPGFRDRMVLTVGQVAVSLVLLIGAGLMIKSMWRLQRVDPGFEAENVLTMTVSLIGSEYDTDDEVIAFYRDLQGRLQALPGVRSASAVNALPISGGDSEGQLTIEARPFAPGEAPGATFRRILPNYFRTAGIPLLQGREFDARDGGSEPFVVIISQSIAKLYWPDGDAIGRRIKVGPEALEPWLTIVGVVADVRNEGLDAALGLDTYEPHTQRVWRTMNVIVRTEIDPLAVVSSVRDEIRSASADLPVYNIATMRERISRSFSARRFITVLLSFFAAIALFLAALGLYGALSFSVGQRTREFGIRAALGADPRDILSLVFRQGMIPVAVGLIVGIGAALVLSRLLSDLVHAVSPSDPVTFVTFSFTLAATALLACYIPARRATRIDPIEALRHE